MKETDFMPAWGKVQENHRNLKLTEEQAKEIAKCVRSVSWVPRYFGAFLLFAGAGTLVASIVGVPPTRVLWIVLTIQFLSLGGIFRLIFFVRWGRIPGALQERKLEVRRGLITGTFGFTFRGPGLELQVGLDHQLYKVVAPSASDKCSLQRTLDHFKERKVPVIAYGLSRTNLLISFEPDQGGFPPLNDSV